jgi:metal-responsive CopG/Arc/MetJ family transcriptional regulator
MVRTQMYLTKEEQDKLNGISAETGKPQSELIREAIDSYVIKHSPESRKGILKKAKGIWENKTKIVDIQKMREEFNRY